MNKAQLLALKDEIDAAKTKVSELKGTEKYLMKQLKDQHGCDSVEAAEKKLATLDKQIEKVQKQIEKGTQELEAKYELTEEEE